MDFDTRETFIFPSSERPAPADFSLTVREDGGFCWGKFLISLAHQFFDGVTYASKVSYGKLHCVIDIYNSDIDGKARLVNRRLYHSLGLSGLAICNTGVAASSNGGGTPIQHTIKFKCGPSRPLPIIGFDEASENDVAPQNTAFYKDLHSQIINSGLTDPNLPLIADLVLFSDTGAFKPELFFADVKPAYI
jgi:hypothetical protein